MATKMNCSAEHIASLHKLKVVTAWIDRTEFIRTVVLFDEIYPKFTKKINDVTTLPAWRIERAFHSRKYSGWIWLFTFIDLSRISNAAELVALK